MLDEHNASLSATQDSTQSNQSGLFINTLEEITEKETPGVIRLDISSTNTDTQDTHVLRKISALVEMINSLQDVRSMQSNIMTLIRK